MVFFAFLILIWSFINLIYFYFVFRPKLKHIQNQIQEDVKKMMSEQLHVPSTRERTKAINGDGNTKPSLIASCNSFGPKVWCLLEPFQLTMLFFVDLDFFMPGLNFMHLTNSVRVHLSVYEQVCKCYSLMCACLLSNWTDIDQQKQCFSQPKNELNVLLLVF